MHCLMHWLDAMFDPWPPFTFCRPQAIVRTQEFRFQTNLPSPARRGSRSRTASPPTSPPTSPPAPLAIRKAPSASVESIQPRSPRPCEVGRPKGRRRKSRRQSHNFLSTDPAGRAQLARHALGRLPTPPPLPENLVLGLHKKLPSAPLEHNLQAPLFSGSWSARTRPEPTQESWVGLIFQGDIQGDIGGAVV